MKKFTAFTSTTILALSAVIAFPAFAQNNPTASGNPCLQYQNTEWKGYLLFGYTQSAYTLKLGSASQQTEGTVFLNSTIQGMPFKQAMPMNVVCHDNLSLIISHKRGKNPPTSLTGSINAQQITIAPSGTYTGVTVNGGMFTKKGA